MNTEEYRSRRKALMSAKKAADKTFSKIDTVMDLSSMDEWPEYHKLKGKAYEVIVALDKKINNLKKHYKNERTINRKRSLVG